MTTEILSQDEIDSLLKGVQTGDVETGGDAGSPDGAAEFNFRSQERIIRGRMPGLEIANERFARTFRNSLATILRRFVDVSVHGITMMKFGDFMKTLPLPSNINMFRMKPLNGLSLFIIEAPMVFAFVECFFGGQTVQYVKRRAGTSPHRAEGHQEDQGERLRGHGGVLGRDHPFRAGIHGQRDQPPVRDDRPPAEIVIKIQLNVELENFTGKVYFCIPYSVVEPLKEKLCSGFQAERFEIDERWQADLKEKLMETRVHLTGEVGRVELSIGDVMALKVGSVISLGIHKDEPLLVKVRGHPKYRARPVSGRGTRP
jgi:flagellar motor switch protein FliM